LVQVVRGRRPATTIVNVGELLRSATDEKESVDGSAYIDGVIEIVVGDEAVGGLAAPEELQESSDNATTRGIVHSRPQGKDRE
jgi:hypothetical protein